MPKNIIIYSDGTGQSGGLKPDQRLSNIYKMYRASRVGPDSQINPNAQVAFYDPGLGSGENENLLSHPIKRIRKVLSSALGQGLNINIADCYEAILKYYEPGDRVYLFGFSRGAYTVRCVANVMNLCGIPTHNEDGSPLPRYGKKLRSIAEEAVFKVYEHGASKDRNKYELEREEQARRFREKYGSEGKGRDNEPQGNIQPYFIGVFDTVAALGTNTARRVAFNFVPLIIFFSEISYFIAFNILPLWGVVFISLSILLVLYILKTRIRYIKNFPKKRLLPSWHLKSWGLSHYDHYLDNLVPYARHAQSIDENRKNFPRVYWGSRKDYKRTMGQKPAWLKQVWFAGNHSDIGGSYPENESRLSDISLQWMLNEIEEIPEPIIFNKNMLNLHPIESGMQHDEIKQVIDLWPNWWPRKWRLSWPKEIRQISELKDLHPTVLKRFEFNEVNICGDLKKYRPEALKNHNKTKQFYN